MNIGGKVHLLFEQSGTFKNQFIRLGIEAEDYDIQNHFGETDHVCDLFAEIDSAYICEKSIFDRFDKDDLVIAFYPCIYFCESSECAFKLWHYNYRGLSDGQKIEKIIMRENKRHEYYTRLLRLVSVCMLRGLRIVIENPYTLPHYLRNNFLKEPDVIDKDRTMRGDNFRKRTAYWFFNCEPTHGCTVNRNMEVRTIRKARPASRAGLCSEERSMISPEYAKNFILDFILGKPSDTHPSQTDLFD